MMYNFLMQEGIFDVIILGSGPAGLTAGIYTARASLRTLVVGGNLPGGQLTTTSDVENFPGFPKGITGNELISNMREQASKFGCEFIDGEVKGILGAGTKGFKINIEDGSEYWTKSVIIATGASARWLDIPSEEKLKGRGVSVCATCDGYFYKEKVVGVVGGGDSAMEEAIFLSKFAKKVYVFVSKTEDKMRAGKYLINKAKENPKVEMIFNVKVKEILGEGKVTGVILENSVDEKETKCDLDGLFLAIGRIPNTGFLKGFVELDDNGFIKVTNNTKTSVEGIFAAGDVGDFRYRQAITAAGMGGMAAIDVDKFLEEK